MDPIRLSATGIEKFEDCEAGYKAHIIDKTPDITGDAAGLGGVCHEAMELWVAEGWYLNNAVGFDKLVELFDAAWWKVFSDTSRYQEGVGMLENWYSRAQMDWKDRIVLSTESKETFDLPTSRGKIPVTYIFDRLDDISGPDQPPGTVIEVVDYKTYMVPIKKEELEHKIQARVYAVAARLKFPQAKQIWVTFDHTRYGQASRLFTVEECRETWTYLRNVAERIYESDGSEEKINQKCQYCLRKLTCETLLANVAAGGFASLDTIEKKVDTAARLTAIMKAAASGLDGLKSDIWQHLEDNGLTDGLETDETFVKITSKSQRTFPKERVAKVLGPQLMARFGTLKLKVLDQLIKDEVLTEEQIAELKPLITKSTAPPMLKFTEKGI